MWFSKRPQTPIPPDTSPFIDVTVMFICKEYIEGCQFVCCYIQRADTGERMRLVGECPGNEGHRFRMRESHWNSIL
jgi:hypothetical protein